MISLQLVFLVLISLGQVCSQQGHDHMKRTFPQWLTGLIAVVVFLFLVLVVYVANRFWEKKSQGNMLADPTIKSPGSEEVVSNGTHGHYATTIENVRSEEHEYAYENPTEVSDNVRTTAF
ncbi:PDZK1-interacting protein 1 [Rhinophrynus dorsalis]